MKLIDSFNVNINIKITEIETGQKPSYHLRSVYRIQINHKNETKNRFFPYKQV